MTAPETPATRAVAAAGLPHRLVEYGRVRSLEEAARRRGVEVGQVIKSMVVRVAEGEHVIVLVPGDRVIDWPKLRALLGESRMSLAPADEAFEVTGYKRGAITPFGSKQDLPIVCDEAVLGMDEISVGGGVHGVSIHLAASDLVDRLEPTVADVTKPA